MHKFKLKKDGKVVGYETHEYDKFTGTINIFHGKMAGVDNGYNIAFVENAYITHQTKHPFVCCDKNGDEVYAGDKTNNGIVEYNEEKLRWVAGNVPIRHYKNIKLIKETD